MLLRQYQKNNRVDFLSQMKKFADSHENIRDKARQGTYGSNYAIVAVESGGQVRINDLLFQGKSP